MKKQINFRAEDRLMVHDWLKYHPECIKFFETLMQHLDEKTRNQIYYLVAEFWRWDIYPDEHNFIDCPDDVKLIATHLVYYFQFVKQQRSALPESAKIPTTNLYSNFAADCVIVAQKKKKTR